MSTGKLVRKLLGKRMFPVVGRYYRSLFVDLDKVAQFMCEAIPKDSHLLDIGGGDGEVLSHLMALRDDISATLIDLQMSIGDFIPRDFRSRVTLLPETSIRQFTEMTWTRQPTCIIISDVIHHIPPAERAEFFRDLFALVEKSRASLLIKDVEPGYLVSRLGYWSDHYVSGDKDVSPVSRTELCRLLENAFGSVMIREMGLFSEDRPNYLLSITHDSAFGGSGFGRE